MFIFNRTLASSNAEPFGLMIRSGYLLLFVFLLSACGGENPAPLVIDVQSSVGSHSSVSLTAEQLRDRAVIEGDDGDNTLIGGPNAEVLDGGEGVDTAAYTHSPMGVYVDLARLQQRWGDAENDTLVGIENISGTLYDDILQGDDNSNSFWGGGGSDTLLGGRGDDHYFYRPNAGITTIIEGSDYFVASPLNIAGAVQPVAVNIIGAGIDTLHFDSGITLDELNFHREANNLIITFANNPGEIHLIDWFFSQGQKLEVLAFANGISFDIGNQVMSEVPSVYSDWIGGDGTDNFLSGNLGHDIIAGRAGNDSLYGGDGEDWIIGGLGQDFIDGGNGFDTVAYFDSREAVTVSLNNSVVATGGSAEGDTFLNVENLIGSVFDDSLTGTDRNNILTGNEGDDTLHGLAGSDHLFGNDALFGGSGQDYLFGGAGDDWLSAGTFNDVLHGGEGNDTLYGDEANDELYGDEGDDILYGGEGRDSIYGGDGADTLYGDAGDDELIAGAGDDVVTGNAGDDHLYGDAGADTLSGDEGNDFIEGGSGIDLIYGNDGNDILYGGDDALNITNEIGAVQLIEGGAGNDLLLGSESGNRIIGGLGSDFIVSGSGNDILEGGDDETDFYIFDSDFGQDIVIEDPARQRLDELVFANVSTSSLWFQQDGQDLIISVIGTENTVRVVDFARIRIHVDEEGETLRIVDEAYATHIPIEGFSVKTFVLSFADILQLIESMASAEPPANKQSSPVLLMQSSLPDILVKKMKASWKPSQCSSP